MKDVEDIYELSPLQQGMLFDAIALDDPGMYRVYLAYDLRGSLDVDALRRAWQWVTERQPVMRTSIHWEGMEKPIQVVHRIPLPIEEADWRGLSEAEVEQQTREYLEQERERPFELTEAPLVRLALFRTSDDGVRLVWWLHHLLIEGWSAGIVFNEVLACYRALAAGKPIELAPAPLFRDFLLWLQSQDPKKVEAYWRNQLRGFDAPVAFPFDKASAGGMTSVVGFESRHLQLSEGETDSLNSFVRRHKLTQSSLVQGAWAILLSRYSGQDDVTFGALVSGRSAPVPGIESIVGMTVNTVAVRVPVPGDALVLPWLRERLDQQVEMIPFEHCSLAQVRNWSDVPRSSPLFETLVAFRNWAGDLSLSGLGSDSLEVREVESQQFGQGYPITLEISPGPRMTLSAFYDGSRFDGEDVERVLGHLRSLLNGLIEGAESGRRLCDLSMLDPAERQQLLVEWNHTAADYPRNETLSSLLSRVAEQRPDSIAAVCGDASLSYRELGKRANQLAHHLRGLGVGPKVRVGLCTERGLDMLVGLLGILKAGAAYVPLDPAYPSERIAFMLEDSEALVLITQEPLLSALPAHDARVVRLDADRELIAAVPTDDPDSRCGPEDVAYVIYTSGSTGKPKGVQVRHRSVVNFLHTMARTPGLDVDDVLVAVTTLSFDIAALELFLPLFVGARVVIADAETTADACELAALLSSSGATAMQATPATWRMLVDSGWQGRPTLSILCGGEALPRDLANTLLPLGRRVWNLYGPTETTIWSTVFEVTAGEGSVPIGRPIGNTQVYVLDERREPVPTGIPGELYIGGDGVTLGYLKRPELSSERFIADPFSDSLDARLYRTGDHVRFLADGNLECLGRLDQQVKLRGFRIELGEIEASLRAHSRVRDAAAVVREDVPGDQRMVAYVVPIAGEVPLDSELRAHAREALPEYMVPQVIVHLPALPLTPNGKVDRRALPAPGGERRLEHQYVAPTTDLERSIAEIWQSLLGVDRVGLDDNFFDLGGHSLLLVRLQHSLREELELEPKILELFEHPTISGLTRFLLRCPDVEPGIMTGEERAFRRDAGIERMRQKRARRSQV